LLCVGRLAGQSEARIWAGELGGAGVGGNPENATVSAEGEVVWRFGGPGSDLVCGPAAAMDLRLFVPVDRLAYARGDGIILSMGAPPPARHGIVCLQSNGPAHEAPAEHWFAPATNQVTSSPGASKTAVVFSDGRPGMAGRRMQFVSASTGRMQWSVAIADDAYGFACLTPEAVLAEDEVGTLTSFHLDGGVRWRRALASPEVAPIHRRIAGQPAVVDGLIIAATADALVALDELEGTMLWRAAMSDAPTTGPILHRKSIILGTATGIAACSIIDGRPLWHASVGPVKSALIRCGALVAATTSVGELIVLDADSGQLRGIQAQVTPDIPPLPVGDALLVAVQDGWMRFVLADKSMSRWLEIPTAASSQAISSPSILSSSSIYFSGDAGRLLRAGGKAAP
jgi:outer membrane protein assembly factor BamB